MKLENIKWINKDFEDFRKHLRTFKNTDEKVIRRKTITKAKLDVLAIYQKDIKNITNKLIKNDCYLNYLKDTNFIYYEETLIYGNVVSQIKDFKLFKYYLNKLSLKTDNWATCDNLSFKLMYKLYKEELFELSVEYIKDKLTFRRRIGLLMLFEYINDEDYEMQIYKILDDLSSEKEYYVNMAASWLLCEIFVKSRENALDYYKENSTNKFIINKSISKCRDSFRVSDEDKELLLSYRK